MKIPSYLVDVLHALRLLCDQTVYYVVERAGPHVYRVAAPDNCCVVVDTKRRIVEDSIDGMLPRYFPGRIEPEHLFRVRWTRDDGELVDIVIESSSAALARITVRAPATASAEEVHE